MHTASWTRIRIEAALALTTAAEEPRVAVTSSRIPHERPYSAGLTRSSSRATRSTWWQVKDSNLRSFRDGSIDLGRQAVVTASVAMVAKPAVTVAQEVF
jgi:hypothetical protein